MLASSTSSSSVAVGVSPNITVFEYSDLHPGALYVFQIQVVKKFKTFVFLFIVQIFLSCSAYMIFFFFLNIMNQVTYNGVSRPSNELAVLLRPSITSVKVRYFEDSKFPGSTKGSDLLVIQGRHLSFIPDGPRTSVTYGTFSCSIVSANDEWVMCRVQAGVGKNLPIVLVN